MSWKTLTPLRPDLSVETQTSQFDRVSAGLVSLILLAGFAFLVLFGIWLSGKYDFSKRIGGVKLDPTGGAKTPEFVEEIVEPGVQEFPEIASPELASTLSAVSEAISSVPSSLSNGSGDSERVGVGTGSDDRIGEPRPVGTPTHKRWSILFETEDIDAYVKQLAFFKIDVAAIHSTNNDIWRVRQSDLGSELIASSREAESENLRFSHKRERLRNWDREICRRAGIEIGEIITAQFYPDETVAMMTEIELSTVSAEGRKVEEVRKTSFRIVPKGDSFRFEIAEINYH